MSQRLSGGPASCGALGQDNIDLDSTFPPAEEHQTIKHVSNKVVKGR